MEIMEIPLLMTVMLYSRNNFCDEIVTWDLSKLILCFELILSQYCHLVCACHVHLVPETSQWLVV